MDINQLKYFITVAQTLNFSEAARRCGITQPSISHSIVELEKQLGAPLFLRSRKAVSMTDAGRELLPKAIEIVDIAEKTALRIRQMEQGESGSLSISALTTCSAVLSQCLTVFSSRYPNILTDISFTSGRGQMAAMSEAKYDLHFAVREMVPTGDSFDTLQSHTDRLCVAIPAGHPLASMPLDFSKLQNERFISVSETDSPGLHRQIMEVCTARGYKPNVVCTYDRAEAVVLSVGAGMGVSIIPEGISRVFYAENVRFIPIPGGDAVRTYVVAWRKAMPNPAARLFLDIVREQFKSEQA
ncbi:MAG: LysR family transcriptional regulator [Oscillospiraceae bacterium]|nr:LysR family transcriptional regulator [Oscillospiraceae bacterium]